MKECHSIKRIMVTLLIFIVAVTVFLVIKTQLPKYLSVTKKVDANILVVEGWLPPYAMDNVARIYKEGSYKMIITTGLKSSDYFNVATNGYLIFKIPEKVHNIKSNGVHRIAVNAFSELPKENAAHFNLFLNDSLAGDFVASTHKRRYGIAYHGNLTNLDSVVIQFDNDKVGDFGDRNLFVKQLVIDDTIHIPYQKNTVYDIGKADGRVKMINDFDSYADLARKRLILSSVDSSAILAIPGKNVSLNRTITSAIAFRKWADTTQIKISGINIVTLGFHARRTYLTYRKILKNNINVGVISLYDRRSHYSRRNRVYKLTHEFVGIIYYWFILHIY